MGDHLNKKLLAIDNNKCVCVEFVNEFDQQLKCLVGVGFQAWLEEEEKIDQLVSSKTQTTIYWPNVTIQPATASFKKCIKKAKFKPVCIRLLKQGDWTSCKKAEERMEKFDVISPPKRARHELLNNKCDDYIYESKKQKNEAKSKNCRTARKEGKNILLTLIENQKKKTDELFDVNNDDDDDETEVPIKMNENPKKKKNNVTSSTNKNKISDSASSKKDEYENEEEKEDEDEEEVEDNGEDEVEDEENENEEDEVEDEDENEEEVGDNDEDDVEDVEKEESDKEREDGDDDDDDDDDINETNVIYKNNKNLNMENNNHFPKSSKNEKKRTRDKSNKYEENGKNNKEKESYFESYNDLDEEFPPGGIEDSQVTFDKSRLSSDEALAAAENKIREQNKKLKSLAEKFLDVKRENIQLHKKLSKNKKVTNYENDLKNIRKLLIQCQKLIDRTLKNGSIGEQGETNDGDNLLGQESREMSPTRSEPGDGGDKYIIDRKLLKSIRFNSIANYANDILDALFTVEELAACSPTGTTPNYFKGTGKQVRPSLYDLQPYRMQAAKGLITGSNILNYSKEFTLKNYVSGNSRMRSNGYRNSMRLHEINASTQERK